MASVWSTYDDVNEEFGTRVENWDNDNPSVRVTLRCKMAERYRVITDIVGNYRNFPENTPVTLAASAGSVVLDRACKKPDAATESKYETGYDSLITVIYRYIKGLPYVQSSDPDFPDSLYAEEEMEPNMKFLTDDYRKYAWGKAALVDPTVILDEYPYDKPLKRGEEPGIPFYSITLKRMAKGYIGLPVGYEVDNLGTGFDPVSFEKWPGYVHRRAYASDLTGIFYAPNTLLFTQPKAVYGAHQLKYVSFDPDVPLGPTWKITAKLLYQPQGWNAFWRQHCDENGDEASGWYPIVYKGCPKTEPNFTTHKPYKSLDMSEFIFSSAEFPPVPWPPTTP
jgi:hypothetical protein